MGDWPPVKIALACALFIFGANSGSHGDEAKLRFAAAETADARAATAVLTEVYGRLGIEIEVEYLNGKLALARADSGIYDGDVQRIDGVAAVFPNLVQVSIPVNYLEGMAFANKRDIQIGNWHDLRTHRVGIVRGILFAEQGTQNMVALRAESYEQLLGLLAQDSIDVAVIPRIHGLVTSRALGNTARNRGGILPSNAVLETLFLYHYLNKRHQGLVIRLERELKQMLRDGTTKDIRNRVYHDLLKLDLEHLGMTATRSHASPYRAESHDDAASRDKLSKRIVLSTPAANISDPAKGVLRKAYASLGYNLQVRQLTSLSHANAGMVDGDLMRIDGVTRSFKNLIQIPIPLSLVHIVAYSRDPGIRVRGWSSLFPYRIGILDGILITDQQTRGMVRRTARSIDQLGQWLAGDEIDIAVLPREAEWFGADTQATYGVRELPGVLESIFLYHYLNKEHKHLVPELTRELKRMLFEYPRGGPRLERGFISPWKNG